MHKHYIVAVIFLFISATNTHCSNKADSISELIEHYKQLQERIKKLETAFDKNPEHCPAHPKNDHQFCPVCQRFSYS